MDSAEAAATCMNHKLSMVDPFLVEALEDPRHRLTILRMELDIQRFLRNPDQHQFEFQHLPTSYLRLVAHRVAQHYGLTTMVQDGGLDGLGIRILVRKTAESRYPCVRLSEVPANQSANDEPKDIKIAIKPRPNSGSVRDANELGAQRNRLKSVEERKEEYDRARARIFSASRGSDSNHSQDPVDRNNACLSRNAEVIKNVTIDAEKNIGFKESSTSSQVAIFRDREKDRYDPDYDRSYKRYVRVPPANPNLGIPCLNMQPFQLPVYDARVPQLGLIPGDHTMSYHPLASPAMQWPSASMLHGHSYEQFRHSAIQGPTYQQPPLSSGYLQNHIR